MGRTDDDRREGDGAARCSFGAELATARSAGAADVWREAVAAVAAGSAAPPLSFRLGAEAAGAFWRRAARACEPAPDPAGTPGAVPAGTRQVVTYTDPQTRVVCRLEFQLFAAFPAVEWVAFFTNAGDVPSPVLADVEALDLGWSAAGEAFAYRSPGAAETPEDFQFQREPLQTIRQQGRRVELSAGTEGRSSAAWLPFLNLQTGTDGLIVALGWSGQWHMTAARDGAEVRVRAGMDDLRLRLDPGETIRTPRVLLVHWRGRPLDGQNLLRRILWQHYLPRVDGRPVEAPVCFGAWGGAPTPVHLRQLELIARHRLPYDCYWIDAGWYGTSTQPCPNVFEGEWWKVGDWRVNANYHPEGLRPMGERAHAAGMQFLLWVEPERALQGTPVTLEHPEWFLQAQPGEPRRPGDTLLLNLGHPEARAWVVELISGLVTQHELDWYRQDFNLGPLPFWRANDPAERQGITEIRYVEGLYAFWDELRRRHPRLRIDNCASGGRRLDLELLSRSVPLWRDDYNCFATLDPEALQVHGLGLSHWLPVHGTSPLNKDPGDTYRFRSVVCPGVFFSFDECGTVPFDEQTYPWDWHRKMLAEQRRTRPFWSGELYPLTACSSAPDAWIALQLHRPDLDAGMVLAFRRAASPLVEAEFRLGGLAADASYAFEDADDGTAWVADGHQLREPGLRLRIGQPRTSRLLFYRRTEG